MINKKEPNPGPIEDRLDKKVAGQEIPDLQAQHGQRWHEGIAENMATQHGAFLKSFRPRRSDIVRSHRFQDRRAHHPRDHRQAARRERHRRQQKMQQG